VEQVHRSGPSDEFIKIVWGRAKGYKLLVAGSASGELVGALRERGIDAWGIENNRYIHGKTPKALRKYNKFGSLAKLPIRPRSSTSFSKPALSCPGKAGEARGARTQPRGEDRLRIRIGHQRHGPALIDRYDLLRGVKKLGTWWEWSELFFGNGFDLSMHRRDTTDAVGRDAQGQQGAGRLVRGRGQPALFVL
jgi:hypothetical protein